MEAGREMDALVAEKVFGERLEKQCPTFQEQKCNGAWQTRCGSCGGYGHGGCYGNGSGQVQRRCEDICYAPHYSTDIGAAWEVVEKLVGRGMWIVVKRTSQPDWLCVLVRPAADLALNDVRTVAETPPLAICRAALLAVSAPK